MSIHKNFTINREKTNGKIRASDIAVGDVFEREGSLHIRVKACDISDMSTDKIRICNINTGSVWSVTDNECYTIVENCKISYQVKS